MEFSLKPIYEQVVVIFGATSGIGLQTAGDMAREGARVAVIGRDQASVDQAVNYVRRQINTMQGMQQEPLSGSGPLMGGSYTGSDMSGGSSFGGTNTMLNEMTADQMVMGLVADATRWEEVKAAADQVVAHFGRIDTWVQAAAVSEWALFEDTTPEEFRQVIDVNLTGMAYGAKAALPHLKQQGGAMIFISSVAGRTPLPYQSAYSAAKHGVVALSNVLSMEMKHEGQPVSVTNILPSSINTPLFSKSRTHMGVEPKPMPPVYSAELVSRAIQYAAQHPIREISVGGAGWLLQMLRRLSPRMANGYIGTTGFQQQRSDQPKTAIAPDNLYEHVEGYNRVNGEYGEQAMSYSPQLWLATHPRAVTAIKAAAVGSLVGFAAWRIIRMRRKPSVWKQLRKQVMKQVNTTVQRIPFPQQKSRMERVIELLAGLPLVGLLPFFNKPSLRDRVQRGVTRGVQKGVEKLPVEQTQKMLKRAQDRIPEVHMPKVDTGKMVEKLQERMPSRRERVTETKVIKGQPDQIDVDVRVSQRNARKAEKITARL